jgi:hypothetical protein
LMRTTAVRPVSTAVTWTDVPNGNVLCAATRSSRDVRPREAPWYQEAMPVSLQAGEVAVVPAVDVDVGAGIWVAQAVIVSSRRQLAHLAFMMRSTPGAEGGIRAQIRHNPDRTGN